jgi:hypothetical protein
VSQPRNWSKVLHSNEIVGWGVVFDGEDGTALQNGPFTSESEARECLVEMAHLTHRTARRKGWRVIRMVETRTYEEVRRDYGQPTV